MAVYGLNFNNTPIPDHVRRRFAQRRSFDLYLRLHLQGVCNTRDEVNMMILQAHNGKRTVIPVGPRRLRQENWYGIYCG